MQKEKRLKQMKEYWKNYRLINKEKILNKHKERRHELRLEILNFLGGKCIKCGFSDWRALQIDHVNGGGVKEIIKDRLREKRYYNKIKESPKQYQLLCANCNWIKKYENKEVRK